MELSERLLQKSSYYPLSTIRASKEKNGWLTPLTNNDDDSILGSFLSVFLPTQIDSVDWLKLGDFSKSLGSKISVVFCHF